MGVEPPRSAPGYASFKCSNQRSMEGKGKQVVQF